MNNKMTVEIPVNIKTTKVEVEDQRAELTIRIDGFAVISITKSGYISINVDEMIKGCFNVSLFNGNEWENGKDFVV